LSRGEERSPLPCEAGEGWLPEATGEGVRTPLHSFLAKHPSHLREERGLEVRSGLPGRHEPARQKQALTAPYPSAIISWQVELFARPPEVERMARHEIRPMAAADADVVRRLDQLAFGNWMRRRGQMEPMPLRTRENVLSNRARDPQGCFVAELEGHPVGYVFSRAWGRVGWFGTLGVHPEFQGRSIGRALVEASVAYLDRRGCTTIGLGTMPEEPNNVALYARCGFRPDHLTVILARAAEPSPRPVPHTLWSELSAEDQKRLLRDVLPRISGEVRPGLDFAAEVRAATGDEYGETLLFGDHDHPWGFAVVRTRSKWEDRPQMSLNVEASALAAGAERRLDEMVTLLADYACQTHLSKVLLPVNGVYWSTLQRLLALDCRAVHTRLRMILRQEPPRPGAVELCTWAA